MTHDPESHDLLTDQWRAFKAIADLVDVSDRYRETLFSIAGRVIGNAHVPLRLYMVSQLSELGVGSYSDLGRETRQSDVREDVILNFIPDPGGSHLRLRVRADRFESIEGGCRVVESFSTHQGIVTAVDRLMRTWWDT